MSKLFEPEPANDNFVKTSKLVYGFPKTGKSTLANYFRDGDKIPLFIATEDGHSAIMPRPSVVKISGWAGFKKLVKYLQDNKKQVQAEHSCFVIDLASDLDEQAQKFICEDNKIKSLADLDHGKGWALHKAEFRTYVTELFDILPVNFIAHSTEKEVMWNNEKIKIQSPTLGKQCFEFVNGKVDIIMWIAPANSKKEHPEIIIKNSTTAIAGSRFPQLVQNFKFDPANLQKTYDTIVDEFKKGVPKGTK